MAIEDLDPASKLGDLFAFTPVPGEIAAGRSGLGMGVRDVRQPLAMVRTRSGLARPWVVTWGNAALQNETKLNVRDDPLTTRNLGGAYALIRWGVRAATHEARVDWQQGGQLQVTGATVDLSVVLPNQESEGGVLPGQAEGAGIFYEENAYHGSIVPGTVGRAAPVYKTQMLGEVPFGAQGWCAIPQFASRVWVTYNIAGGGTPANHIIDTEFRDGGAVGVAPQLLAHQAHDATGGAGAAGTWERSAPIPVPLTAVYFAVELKAPALGLLQNVRAIFELRL